MHTRAVSLAVVAGLAAGLGGVGVGGVQAQTRTWRTPTNGTFSVGSNWVGGVAPGSGNAAAFGLTSSTTPFTVSFAADAGTAGLTVSNQRPTFSLGGFTYNVTGDTLIGGSNGPVLTVTGGTLNLGVSGNPLYMGQNPSQTGSLAVNGATLSTRELVTNGGGRGDIAVTNGGRMTISGDTNVWGVGTRQNWVISGPGSLLTSSGTMRVGNDGAAFTMQVMEGGAADLNYVPLMGPTVAGQASISVIGEGSSLTARHLQPERGTFSMSVTEGGTAQFTEQLRLGCCYLPGSSTTIVRGAGTTLRINRELAVGFETSGEHTMMVDEGAVLIGDDDGQQLNAWVGLRGRGVLNVDGEATQIRVKDRLHVGGFEANCNGTFNLTGGATATLGAFWTAARTASVATTRLDGGSILTSSTMVEIFDGATVTVAGGSGMEALWTIAVRGLEGRSAELIVGDGSYAFATDRIDLGDHAVGGGPSILTLDGGTAFAGNYVPLNESGVLRGTGTLEALVAVDGLVQPGLPIGRLTVAEAWFNPSEHGRLECQIGGTAAGTTYDQLAVTGHATLRGTLALSLANGFTPTPGQSFDVVTAGTGLTGEFTSVTGTDLGAGRAFVMQYLPGAVRATVDTVTGVKVAEASAAVAEGFRSAPLTSRATFAASPEQTVTQSSVWSTDDPTIAVVSAEGVVTGVGPGTTTVRVAYAGFDDAIPVSVRSLPGTAPSGIPTNRYGRSVPELTLMTPFAQEQRSTLQMLGQSNILVLTGREDNVASMAVGHMTVPTTGVYHFWFNPADTWGSLWIDGDPVTRFQRYAYSIGEAVTLTAGVHELRLDYGHQDLGGPADLRVEWDGPGISRQQMPDSALAGPVTVSYYDTTPYPYSNGTVDLSTFHVMDRFVSPDIDIPLAGDPGQLRFEGTIALPDDATYTFTLNVDDGAIVRFNDEQVLDVYNNGGYGIDHSFTRTLARGIYPVRVDYTDHNGYGGGVRLRVSSPGLADQVVPPAAFGRTPDSGCAADFNGDGFLDFFDYDDYVGCFETGVCPPGTTADFNGDGFADFFDYDDFVLAFETGC